jgi:hypothetical protein
MGGASGGFMVLSSKPLSRHSSGPALKGLRVRFRASGRMAPPDTGRPDTRLSGAGGEGRGIPGEGFFGIPCRKRPAGAP